MGPVRKILKYAKDLKDVSSYERGMRKEMNEQATKQAKIMISVLPEKEMGIKHRIAKANMENMIKRGQGRSAMNYGTNQMVKILEQRKGKKK